MRPIGVLVGLTLLLPAGLPAQTSSRSPQEAAEAFRLDLDTLPVDDAVTPGVPTKADPATGSSTAEPPLSAPASGAFTLDTPIGRLIADQQARAVLDRNLPGLSTDENLPKFRSLSLRAFQPLTGGQLTDEMLAKTQADLASIRPAGKRRFDSR